MKLNSNLEEINLVKELVRIQFLMYHHLQTYYNDDFEQLMLIKIALLCQQAKHKIKILNHNFK